MTQLILTQSSYLLSLLKRLLTSTRNALAYAGAVMIEARQKQANVEVARHLMRNRDFESYSFSEIVQMLEDGKVNR
jgi:hypothetical protein